MRLRLMLLRHEVALLVEAWVANEALQRLIIALKQIVATAETTGAEMIGLVGRTDVKWVITTG